MATISPSLQERIDAAGPSAQRDYRIIVTLDRAGAAWAEEVRLLEGAGLEISSLEEPIGVVCGLAKADAIERIAALPAVRYVEPDEMATGMDAGEPL